jgi:hypothetical protein
MSGLILLIGDIGCSTLRTTDPPRTATEQFLMSEATRRAVEQLVTDALRDRKVFIDSTYFNATAYPLPENLFMIGELRSRLLASGIRLVDKRDQAEIIVELRSGGIGIDRYEFLLGIPSVYLGTISGGNVPAATPEVAVVKSTKQRGFSSIAFVTYWRDTGELVSSSGPFIGKTYREDWWFFGFGPTTFGNIPPAEK